MVCPRCGHENEDRSVCEKCGQFLQSGKRLNLTPMTPEEKRKNFFRKTWLFIKSFLSSTVLLILAFIVFSIIMYGVFYLVTKNMDWDLPEDVENPSTQQSIGIDEDSKNDDAKDDGSKPEETPDESAAPAAAKDSDSSSSSDHDIQEDTTEATGEAE